ncbi:MAG: hypothetical protein LBJ68_01580 [Endomicrobium sp.]|jgi:hypothetical protein|nr:hypothetical protein [Endomicrobium sp.]
MKKIGLIILFLVLLFIPTLSHGKLSHNALQGKIGVGFSVYNMYNSNSKRDSFVPVLAAKYWVSDVIGVEGFTGFNAGDGDKNFYVIGTKLSWIVRSYEDLNIFTSAAMALDFMKSYTGVSIFAGVGAEWFMLNNISLATEVGLKCNAGNNIANVKIYADIIPNLSIKFYL